MPATTNPTTSAATVDDAEIDRHRPNRAIGEQAADGLLPSPAAARAAHLRGGR